MVITPSTVNQYFPQVDICTVPQLSLHCVVLLTEYWLYTVATIGSLILHNCALDFSLTNSELFTVKYSKFSVHTLYILTASFAWSSFSWFFLWIQLGYYSQYEVWVIPSSKFLSTPLLVMMHNITYSISSLILRHTAGHGLIIITPSHVRRPVLKLTRISCIKSPGIINAPS